MAIHENHYHFSIIFTLEINQFKRFLTGDLRRPDNRNRRGLGIEQVIILITQTG